MGEEWNVEEFFTGYKDFIGRLRQRLRGSRESFGVPYLIPQQLGTPTEFFDFTLRTSARHVTFRLRRDNLYLIGYQMENGQWLELGRDGDTHLIEGANFLGFGGSYDNMAGAAGRRSAEGLQVTSNTLETVVSNLATKSDHALRAQSLIVVIMMICEAVRLNPIRDEIAIGQSRIEGWMMDAVRNWGNYSDVLRGSDADPNHISTRRSDLSLPPGNSLVSNAFQVVQILDIILSPCYAPSPRRFPRMILDNDDDPYCFLGRPLVEVFSVSIDNIDKEDPGQLYDTIVVNDGLTQIIYNCPRSYVESICPGQNVTIIGPQQSIWAQRSFTIQFLLTDSDSWSPDDEVVNDNISWDAFDFCNASMYDKPTSQQVKGKYGSATVNYAVMRNASTALVTISLQEGGEDTVEVYGNIDASYSDWNNYPNAISVLFNRPKNDYLQVRRWQNIPLLKSIVAVPLGSSLKITTNLYDYDPISADDKIAIGTVEFQAEISGHSSKDITGEDGNRVIVTVSWGEAIAPDGDRGYSLRVPHDEL